MKSECIIPLTTVLLLLFPVFAPLEAATVDLSAVRDNTLYEDAEGALSNGAGEYFFVGRVGSRGGEKLRRGVIAFDIAGRVPAGATVNSATLTLHMSKTVAGSESVELRRLLADWGEGDSKAVPPEGGGAASANMDASWVHTFYLTDTWGTPGGDFSGTVSATTAVADGGFYTWGSTPQMLSDVQTWLDTPSVDFGWALLGNETSLFTAKRFDTKENSTANFRPRLTLNFTFDPIPEPIPEGEVSIGLATVATGLTAPNWGIFASGVPGRLFVADQPGWLWVIDLAAGEKSVFLDVSARIIGAGADERGLLGVAFHPGYATNGKLYTYTSEPATAAADFSTLASGQTPNHQSVIIEWQAPDPTNPASVADPASARVLLRIDQPQSNHNAGAIHFGPDGKLYIALGDGGGADDQGTGHGEIGNGQDTETVLGAILRIDPDGSDSANGQYGVPADNPFVGEALPLGGRLGGQGNCADGCDEIYAFGFRNPFRFSFDSMTGDLYAGDVGQNDIEEVDVVDAGKNYGWNLKEGTFFFDPNGGARGFATNVDPGDLPPALVDPVAEYDHDEGRSVIGGFVYRGETVAELQGRYIFGDWQLSGGSGRLFYLDGGVIRELGIVGRTSLGLFLNGFGQDAEGELYVLGNTTRVPATATGVVLRIVGPCQGDSDEDGDVDGNDASTLANDLGLLDLAGFARDLGRADCPVPL